MSLSYIICLLSDIVGFPFHFFNGAFAYLIRQAWLNVISFHSNELWVEYMSTVIGILIFSTEKNKGFLYSVEKNF